MESQKCGRKISSIEDPNREGSTNLNLPEMDDFFRMGKYTLIVCLFAELTILLQVGNMLYMAYAGAAPILVGCGGHKFEDSLNGEERCAKMVDIIWKERMNKIGQSADDGNDGECSNANLILEGQFHSVNIEFGLHCQTQLVKSTISYQMIGVIIGTILFGYLSDWYGRRRCMLIALFFCIIFMWATSFTHGIQSFTFARFIVNVFNAGTMVILNVFTAEYYPKKQRFLLPNLISWAPNFVFFALMAALAGDWRSLQRFSATLAIPAFGLLFFLNESPRYLIQAGRISEAKEAILRIHRIDGRRCDENDVDLVIKRECHSISQTKGQKKYNYFHLFYNLRFTRYTLAIACSFLVYSLIDYSLLFNMEKLSGSIYLNAIFMGCSRYALHLLAAFLELRTRRLGRKLVHFIAEILIAAAMAICAIFYIFDSNRQFPFIPRAPVLFVLSLSPLLFIINSLANNELFPTCIRNTAYSFGQLFCRIGVVLAPQMFILSNIATFLPYLALMIIALVDAFFFQFNISETKGKPLLANFPNKSASAIEQSDQNGKLLSDSVAT